MGFNVEAIEYNGVCMHIWDIGGQSKIRPLYRHYFVNTDALIFMLDSSDHERIEEAKEEMFDVLRDPNMDGCRTVLTFLNKQECLILLRPLGLFPLLPPSPQDLPGTLTPSVMTEKLDIDGSRSNPLQRRRWYTQGCCAVTGEGVVEGLDWLCQELRQN